MVKLWYLLLLNTDQGYILGERSNHICQLPSQTLISSRDAAVLHTVYYCVSIHYFIVI